jgi:hypothetical protein
MKPALFLCALLLALGGIFSCRTAQPIPERDVSRAEGTPYVARPDSSSGKLVKDDKLVDEHSTSAPKKGLISRIFSAKSPESASTSAPRKCKGCTIVYSTGPATVTTIGKKATAATGDGATATSIEKAKAPVATGTGDATDQTGAQASANIKGDNNTPKLTNTAPEAPGPLAVLVDNLTGPPGYVLAGGMVCLLLYGAWRYKSSRV